MESQPESFDDVNSLLETEGDVTEFSNVDSLLDAEPGYRKAQGFVNNLSPGLQSTFTDFMGGEFSKDIYNYSKVVKSGLMAGLVKRVLGTKAPTQDEQEVEGLKDLTRQNAARLDEYEQAGQTADPAYAQISAEQDDLHGQIDQRLTKRDVEKNKSPWETFKEGVDYVSKAANPLGYYAKKAVTSTIFPGTEVSSVDEVLNEEPDALEMVKGLAEFVWDNPKEAAAEMANALAQDPVLLVTPVGYEAGAALAAGRVAKIGAGLAGAAATAAVTEIPLSIERQLEKSGEVDPDIIMRDMAVTGMVSVPIIGAFKGVGGAVHYMGDTARRILNEPFRGLLERQNTSAGAQQAPGTSVADEAYTPPSAIKQMSKDIINFWAGKSVTPVKEVFDKSPSMQGILDHLSMDETGRRAVGPTMTERVELQQGRLVSQAIRALNEVAGDFSGHVPAKTQAHMLKYLRDKTAAIPLDAMNAAKKIRGVLNDLYHLQKNAGMDVKHLDDFFPRIYNQAKLTSLLTRDKSQSGLKGVLEAHGREADEADNIVRRIVMNDGMSEGANTGFRMDIDFDDPASAKAAYFAFQASVKSRNKVMGQGSTKGVKTASEKSRKLGDIPDEELAPYLDNNLYSVLIKGIEAGVRRAEWTRSFGKNGEELNKALLKGIDEARQAGMTSAQIRKATQRTYDVADALQKNYHPIRAQSWRIFNAWLGTYQNLKTLLWMVFSSGSEVFTPLLTAPLPSYMKALIPAASHVFNSTIRLIYKKFPKAQATEAIEDVSIGMQHAMAQILHELHGGQSNKVSDLFFKLNGAQAWTRFTRIIANETAKNMLARYAKNLDQGVSGPFKKERTAMMERKLREFGAAPDDAIAWLKGGADRNADLARGYGLRFTNQHNMNPSVINKPIWQSNPHLMLLRQLKGFNTTFGNTVVKRMGRELTQYGAYNTVTSAARYAVVAHLIMMASYFGFKVKERLLYGEEGNPYYEDETSEDLYFRMVTQSGFLGAWQFGMGMIDSNKYDVNPIVSLLGPTAGQVDKGIRALQSAKEGDSGKLSKQIAAAIPVAGQIPDVKASIAEEIEPDLEEFFDEDE